MVLALLAWLPFLRQAYNIDDTNFLAMATHSWPNPLKLFDFHINWLGEEARAFDVLANPPLGPWYLALVSPIARGREWVYHLSYWPFLVLTLAGAYRLGRRFAPEQGPLWTMLWTAVAPGLVVAGHALMPDLPLLACYVMGTALTINAFDRDKPAFAAGAGFFAGLSAIYRYSGMTVIPLLLFYAWLNRIRLRTAAPAIVSAMLPIGMWTLISHEAYGRVHWLAMTTFERQTLGADDITHKIIYQICCLSLVIAVAPLIALFLDRNLRRSMWAGAAVGTFLAIGLALQPWLPHLLTKRAALLLEAAMVGTGVIGVLLARSVRRALQAQVWRRRAGREADDLFLACWLLGVFAFNLSLLFVSVRYILLALLPAVLLVQRALPGHLPRRGKWWMATAVSFILALWLAASDQRLADVYRDYVAALPQTTQQRWFTGHWGFQYYMEQAGARPLSNLRWPQPGDEVITSLTPDPQEVPLGVHLELMDRMELHGFPGLRTLTLSDGACFYSGTIPHRPYVRVWLPFGFSGEPQDVLSRWKVAAP